MKELIFATANEHKVHEVRHILNLERNIHLLTLNDIGYDSDIPETGTTMSENAFIKASTIHKKYNKNVFADDSGLEVEALGMAPGLYSARYAGPQRRTDDNIQKLLNNMEDIKNRKARFRSVITLIWDGQTHSFEGIVNGYITHQKQGDTGFGYDPIFIPDGYNQSFAELGDEIKNGISHRYNALKAMKLFLNKVF